MNPFQLMELHKTYFTQNDLLIYQAIIQNPTQVTYKTISKLAADCGVSQPAVSRFVKGLGYNRYQDFRADVISCLAQKTEQDAQGNSRPTYFNTLHQLLQETEKVLTAEYMQELAHYVNSFPRIYTSGTAKSFQPAQLFEILMRKNRRYVDAICRDSLGETADYMDENELLIIFSVSAKAHIMDEISHTAGKVLLVTANPKYDHTQKVDRVVLLPYVTTDPETSFISPVLFNIFVELLVSYISQEIASDEYR